MIKVRKGEVYYVNLDPTVGSEQKGVRPVVVVQDDKGNKKSPTVVVIPITTILKKLYLPTHVIIKKNKFLRKDSTILIEQIRVIDKSRIDRYIGKLNNKQMRRVDKRLLTFFNIYRRSF